MYRNFLLNNSIQHVHHLKGRIFSHPLTKSRLTKSFIAILFRKFSLRFFLKSPQIKNFCKKLLHCICCLCSCKFYNKNIYCFLQEAITQYRACQEEFLYCIYLYSIFVSIYLNLLYSFNINNKLLFIA